MSDSDRQLQSLRNTMVGVGVANYVSSSQQRKEIKEGNKAIIASQRSLERTFGDGMSSLNRTMAVGMTGINYQMHSMGSSMSSIEGSVSSMAGSMSGMSASIDNVSHNIGQMSGSVNRMANSVGQMSSEMRSIGSSLNGVKDQMGNVNHSLVRQTAVIVAMGKGIDTLNENMAEQNQVFREGLQNIYKQQQMTTAVIDTRMTMLHDQAIIANNQLRQTVDRLDAIHETLKTPLTSQARELFNRGMKSYGKALLEPAVRDLVLAAEKNEVDFLTQYYLGKLFLYGVDDDEDVRDCSKADECFYLATKYAKPDIAEVDSAIDYYIDSLFNRAYANYLLAKKAFATGNSEQAQKRIVLATDLIVQVIDKYREQDNYVAAVENVYYHIKYSVVAGQITKALDLFSENLHENRNVVFKVFGDEDFDSVRDDFMEVVDEEYHIASKLYGDMVDAVDAFTTTYQLPENDEEIDRALLFTERAQDIISTDQSLFDYLDACVLLVEAMDIYSIAEPNLPTKEEHKRIVAEEAAAAQRRAQEEREAEARRRKEEQEAEALRKKEEAEAAAEEKRKREAEQARKEVARKKKQERREKWAAEAKEHFIDFNRNLKPVKKLKSRANFYSFIIAFALAAIVLQPGIRVQYGTLWPLLVFCLPYKMMFHFLDKIICKMKTTDSDTYRCEIMGDYFWMVELVVRPLVMLGSFFLLRWMFAADRLVFPYILIFILITVFQVIWYEASNFIKNDTQSWQDEYTMSEEDIEKYIAQKEKNRKKNKDKDADSLSGAFN